MFEEIENKRGQSKALTILAIFVLVATITGVAIAAYTWNFASENANTIGTGNISMSLLESNDVINITNALPIKDATGMALGSDESFDFAITTQASGAPGNISYNISITKVAVDSGYTALEDSNVKVYLSTLTSEGEDQVVAPTLVSSIITSGSTGTLASNLTHNHTTADQTKTTKYRLRMWVDKDVDASDWTENTKNQYKLKVSTSGTLSA